METFFEIAIAITFSIQTQETNPLGEFLSSGIIIFSVLVLLLVFPFSFIMILCHDKKTLKDDVAFKGAYGGLYAHLKVDTTSQRLFYLFFFLRRVLYLSLAFSKPQQLPAIF